MFRLTPVTTIRPNPFPAAAPQPQPLDAGRQAAQRAFFAAAMGQAQAPAQMAPQVAPQPAVEPRPAAAARTPDPSAEPPKRILRPGSLLDIRV